MPNELWLMLEHGHVVLRAVVQDLVFVVKQIPDNRFQRDGDDLIIHVRIKLTDALSETKIDVPHLDGRILRVPLKEAIRPPPLRRLTCLRAKILQPSNGSLE
jgi:DnaJ-class molecular chaperone